MGRIIVMVLVQEWVLDIIVATHIDHLVNDCVAALTVGIACVIPYVWFFYGL